VAWFDSFDGRIPLPFKVLQAFNFITQAVEEERDLQRVCVLCKGPPERKDFALGYSRNLTLEAGLGNRLSRVPVE